MSIISLTSIIHITRKPLNQLAFRAQMFTGTKQEWEGSVIWWNSVNGGTSGNAHGRRVEGPGSSQWTVGDRVQILSYKVKDNCPELSMDVYCKMSNAQGMEETFGGGWTLAMKMDGADTVRFKYVNTQLISRIARRE